MKKTTSEHNILIVKGKFQFQTSNIYGIFAVLIDISQERMIRNYLCMSYFSDFYQIDVKQPWPTLLQKFNHTMVKGEFASTITMDFRRMLSEELGKETNLILQIIKDFSSKSEDHMKTIIGEVFCHIKKDKNIAIEIGYEAMSQEKLIEIDNSVHNKEEGDEPPVGATTDALQVKQGSFMIPANPMFAPLGGIVAKNILPGTKLLMKLDSTSEYGKQWISIFKAYNAERQIILPVIGTVEQISVDSKKNLDILVIYNSNQYTKFTVEPAVKLKIYDSNVPEAAVNPLSSGIQQNTYQKKPDAQMHDLLKDNNFIFLIGLGIFLIIAIIISLLFLYS